LIPNISSQITFLYFKDLEKADIFFSTVLGLDLVEDQGWAKIYQVSKGAFIGAVDETRGSLKAKTDSAVLITFCVEDVQGFADRLREHDINITKDVNVFEEIQIINCFFDGPEGYKFEVQEFLRPVAKKIFHQV
jgi:predicted enzyme related to lactoylglutathione lyase